MENLVKTCRKCGVELNTENKYSSGGNICKTCEKLRMKEYREKYPEKRKGTKDKWNTNNKSRVKEMKKDHYKKRKKRDTHFNFMVKLRNKLTRRMKRQKFGSKESTFYEIIGLRPPEFREYLSSKFQEGMTWENYGWDTWHVDHIIPLSTAKTKEEYCRLWYYTNLQPLWKDDNFKKGNNVL
jgi:uncharacterized Zn finger protein (UPF0148 family)